MNERGAVILGRPAPLSELGAGLDIRVEFEAFAGRLADFERKVLSQLLWERRPPAQPIHSRAVGTVVADSNGMAVIDCGGPSLGHSWNVLALAIGGLTTVTVAAGRADVFVSRMGYSSFSTLAAPGLTDWRDTTATLPRIAFYEPHQIYLHGGEHLYVIVSSGTAGQSYVTCATVDDEEDAVLPQVKVS